MKNRIYLDYNSTSPFSKQLISYLGKGDFPFANPSSVHASGKRSRKLINETRAYLHKKFQLPETDFELVFNSGSTEGIRTFFDSARPGDGVFYCESDHAAVLSVVSALRIKGVHCESLAIDPDGNLLVEEAIRKISVFKEKTGNQAYLNYMVLHNETGVYWPLSEAVKIKQDTEAKVHVDATQFPGKQKEWKNLVGELDAYTFSAHKFGALKGVGFAFIRRDYPYEPLIRGGGQQGGIRGGTENALGIYSIQLALEDIEKLDLDAIERLRDDLEALVLEREGYVVAGAGSKYGRGVNTLNFLVKRERADISLIKFDMEGLEVSSGSACSAGSVEASATLIAMGMHSFAKNGIRVSLGSENLENAQEIKERFNAVLLKL